MDDRESNLDLALKLDVGYGWFRRGAHRAEAEFWEHLGGGGGFWNMMRIYPGRNSGS
jgi:hypothetical protein